MWLSAAIYSFTVVSKAMLKTVEEKELDILCLIQTYDSKLQQLVWGSCSN